MAGTIAIRKIKSKNGITLIELLIVIVIVGILAAIAVPLYTGYLQRARRADAKTALEQVRAVQEMWRAERGTYANGANAETALRTTMGAPAGTVGYYTWSFTVKLANSFTAAAVPIAGGPQVSDGSLFINQAGQKWDSKGYYYPNPNSKWTK
jgi:type IV pilus assembly protein PilE